MSSPSPTTVRARVACFKTHYEWRDGMESTGSVWTNLYNSLDNGHIPVVLADPLKTKAIASARIKSDKVDARILAHLLRGGLVAESYVPPKAPQRSESSDQA